MNFVRSLAATDHCGLGIRGHIFNSAPVRNGLSTVMRMFESYVFYSLMMIVCH